MLQMATPSVPEDHVRKALCGGASGSRRTGIVVARREGVDVEFGGWDITVRILLLLVGVYGPYSIEMLVKLHVQANFR